MSSELSIVQRNLLSVPGYSPYCGAEHCSKGMPRAFWDPGSNQFKCPCGWTSSFDAEFIEKYEKRRLVMAGCCRIVRDFSNSDPHHRRKSCVGETLYCDLHQPEMVSKLDQLLADATQFHLQLKMDFPRGEHGFSSSSGYYYVYSWEFPVGREKYRCQFSVDLAQFCVNDFDGFVRIKEKIIRAWKKTNQIALDFMNQGQWNDF